MANYINSFVPINSVYDVDVIQGLNINSKEFKDFLVRLRQDTNGIAISVNGRDGGFFGIGEYNTGTQLYPNAADPTNYRTIIRTVVDFGALPNAAIKAVNHNINPGTGTTANYIFTKVFATASDTTGLTYFSLNYMDIAGNIAVLTATQTQVVIETNFNATNYNQCVVILEYIVN